MATNCLTQTEVPNGHGAIRSDFQFLDLKAQFAGIRDEVLDAVTRVLDSQHFILGPKDDVGALRPILSIRAEAIYALRSSNFVQEHLVQLLSGDLEHLLVISLPVVAVALQLQQLTEGRRRE